MTERRYKVYKPYTMLRLVLSLLFFIALGQPALAQKKPALEYQVKAAFLFNFTRFINWPPTAFNSPNAPFIIGIIGNDPFGSYIEEIVEGEKVGNHPIAVQRYHDAKDVVNCNILFININEPARVKEILSVIDQQNLLTVSDADNFTKLGGEVRFFKEDNKIRIQINLAAAKASQLEISSKLLRIAKIL